MCNGIPRIAQALAFSQDQSTDRAGNPPVTDKIVGPAVLRNKKNPNGPCNYNKSNASHVLNKAILLINVVLD